MATLRTRCARWTTSLLAVALVAAGIVVADDMGSVTTSAQDKTPDWASTNALQLNLNTTTSGFQPLQYTVIPLTQSLGLNESQSSRGAILIEGNMIVANVSNYHDITDPNDVAYLCCDEPTDDSYIKPDKMLNDLMKAKPKAIVLYSTGGNWCDLSSDGELPYLSVLSMADSGDALNVLGYVNASSSVQVSITGNTTDNNADTTPVTGNGNKSTVAMSVLYSITGLISLLFLIIIATGAVRAHRYPERYGPRGALGGRPRQSRAKGLARAVLDTIPIVKFGNQHPPKPDPELELETATTDGHDADPQGSVPRAADDRAPVATPNEVGETSASAVPTRGDQAAGEDHRIGDGYLGCSICTEDFKVGEDVRVLPCSHQFHPVCVDPWLVNVSGTCPLCRLDLRPGEAGANGGPAVEGSPALPPPLALEADDGDASSTTPRNRFSRIFDVNRLRQATHEEQMEALRQMRAARTEQGPQEADGEEGRRVARLTDKLKDRFRIRTRAQPPTRREGS